MKTIGLIGGMSWESTVTYYQIINEVVRERLGGLHSARILLFSLDFEEIEQCQARGDWEKSGNILADAALCLERAGADFIVICTNTMHKVAPRIQNRIRIPLLHIAEATTERLKAANITRVALLGTKYTMTQDFYKEKLLVTGMDVLIPEDSEVEQINRVIYDELCKGIFSEASKAVYLEIVERLAKKGAQGIILGCTEIGLLIGQADTDLPLFDTARIHAEKAALLSIEAETGAIN
ncbi:putative racemase YgeA [bioreactor metagenome]|uniref:Putative racemase YgeA n=1 Tax=bioreactor metagenome TaxID=1076179 RepID=A0A645BP39_9ZZZZ|nr:aspartate/glutamate racemase family protein [Candidatus Pelethousia sp.]